MSTPVAVKKALQALLRDPGNANCADCKTQSHPRWASWSLGVFICIRCAGIHRSLGTHISKVKSVDLDTWKEEHLQRLVQLGNNCEANKLYEASLEDPDMVARNCTADTNKLQMFIRRKYELKKWMRNPSTYAGETAQTEVPVASSLPQSISRTDSVNSLTPESTASSLSNFKVPTESLMELNTTEPNLTTQVPKSSTVMQRPDLKKSILSLYAKPSSSQTGINQSPGSKASEAAFSNFSGNGSPVPLQTGKQNNISKDNDSSTISLDDKDLFKNVWA